VERIRGLVPKMNMGVVCVVGRHKIDSEILACVRWPKRLVLVNRAGGRSVQWWQTGPAGHRVKTKEVEGRKARWSWGGWSKHP